MNARRVLAQTPNELRVARSGIYSGSVPKRIFSYEEAVTLLPEVQRLTSEAARRVEQIAEDQVDEAQDVVAEWAQSILDMGIEVKGLWLIDFDSGAGYYCWQHPEPSLQYFHGYEEGFPGRVKLN
jgi:hypothetical protein